VKYVSVEHGEWEQEPDLAAIERAGLLDDPEAEVQYRALIERGSVFSMIRLANIFECRSPDQGGPDFEQAEFWYCRAVDSGSAVATFHCGYFYLRRRNYDKVKDMFAIGMQRHYAPSIGRLAHLYLNGLGVSRDYYKAKILLRQASALGNLWAKRGLARMDFNIGENVLIRAKGLVMRFVSDLQFYWEKRRDPDSERLKR
jgi:TPR repeat protein